MIISVLWLDTVVQKWEVVENENYTVEYCVRDGCIDFHGRKILSTKPLPIVQDEKARDYLIPLNTIRAIEID